MAYYPGESLAEKIRRGPLRLPVALDFTLQIGEGLAKAHEHKIVHRDIKPGNLMVTDDGIIKILDFGLATAQSQDMDEPGAIVGTLKFMSPERFGYRPVDHRCDIWALGVVLYNMITARLPFDCPDSMELMYRIKESEPEPFSAPPELRAIILKALAKYSATRYQSMGDLVADVRALQLRLPGLPELGKPEQMWSADPSVQPTITGDTLGWHLHSGRTTAADRAFLRARRLGEDRGAAGFGAARAGAARLPLAL